MPEHVNVDDVVGLFGTMPVPEIDGARLSNVTESVSVPVPPAVSLAVAVRDVIARHGIRTCECQRSACAEYRSAVGPFVCHGRRSTIGVTREVAVQVRVLSFCSFFQWIHWLDAAILSMTGGRFVEVTSTSLIVVPLSVSVAVARQRMTSDGETSALDTVYDAPEPKTVDVVTLNQR